jgi:hypothetical protein
MRTSEGFSVLPPLTGEVPNDVRLVFAIGLGLLVLYCAVLVGVELQQGPAVARTYLQDEPGPVRFAHVNTTVSVGLLWATALLFAVCARVRSRGPARRGGSERALLIFLSAFFVVLGIEERFRLCPLLAEALATREVNVLLALAGLGAAAFAVLGWRVEHTARELGLLALGGTLGGFALFGDVFLHAGDFLRHSAEDLPKIWAEVLFLTYAWGRLTSALDEATLLGPLAAAPKPRWGSAEAWRGQDLRSTSGWRAPEWWPEETEVGGRPAKQPSSQGSHTVSHSRRPPSPHLKKRGHPHAEGAPELSSPPDTGDLPTAPPRKLLSR